MGIKNINKLLKSKCNRGIRNISIEKLRKKYIGIDTSIYLYKYTYMGNMLECFLKQINHLLSYEITPIYFFDGKPSEEKMKLIEKRNNEHKKKLEKIEEMNNELEELEKIENPTNDILEQILTKEEQIRKKKKNTIRINKNDLGELKKILKNLGIYYYECDGEADIYMKSFSQKKLLDYVITEDLDFLTHGCENILYNYNYNSEKLKLYNLNQILNDLGMNYKSFVDFCIMLGCDYSCKIPGFGPKTGYKLIKEYKSYFELKDKKQIKIPENFQYQESLKMFIEGPEILINKKMLKLQKDNINKQELEEMNLNIRIIEKIIHKIENIKYEFNILDFLHKK
jgi:flap endonuclease-1|tara:strand:- start:1105 stop:2124 length:1020 start_codon:yes stop_codon:yes gene_type:complete